MTHKEILETLLADIATSRDKAETQFGASIAEQNSIAYGVVVGAAMVARANLSALKQREERRDAS